MQEIRVYLDEEALEKLYRIGKALRQMHATLRRLLTLAEGLEAAEAEGKEKAREVKDEHGGEPPQELDS